MVHLQETPIALYLLITDNGNGFDVDQVMSHYERRGSLGMVNIQERIELIGGELSLQSMPGQGTQIRAHAPKAAAERR